MVANRRGCAAPLDQGATFLVRRLDVDDDFAVDVAAGLKLDCGADLLHWEACCDGYPKLARCNKIGDLIEGSGGGVGAVGRGDVVDLCSDGGDPLVGYAEFPCGLHSLGAVQVDRGGDARGS